MDSADRPALLWANMTQEELHRLARFGAEARLAELQLEIRSIRAAFPDLRRGASAQDSPSARVGMNGSATQLVAKQRRPRKMSADARKRIGDAQRRRWAEVRARQGTGDSDAGVSAVGGARKKR